ncbi:MAG: hypothetical protein R3194_05250, partial [Limnobacter sp.]|nr:hypothetical protein [Limnobacter sp.]
MLILASGTAYLVDSPKITANGGTWLGYTLGTVGALLIAWLLWLGVRKRQYTKDAGNFRGWVSAHVYLGVALAFVGTLHAGFQLGWNVHSLAYVLMMMVILSGLWGLTLYVRLPTLMSNTLNRQSPEQIVEKIEGLDKESAKWAKSLQDSLLKRAIETSARQGIFNAKSQRRRGRVSDCKTRAACEQIEKAMSEQGNLIGLYQIQIQRLKALAQLRHYYSQRYWLDMWLTIHVPLSFGL